MQVVGDKLVAWTGSCRDELEIDQFGRSAFNRYYYAAFLLTRQMLGEFDSKWRKTGHGQLPDLLRTGVRKRVTTELKALEKANLITHIEKSRMSHQVISSLSDLAALLAEAYAVRGIADYEPEELIQVESSTFALHNYKIGTASQWPSRTSSYCKTIRKIWSDAGLA